MGAAICPTAWKNSAAGAVSAKKTVAAWSSTMARTAMSFKVFAFSAGRENVHAVLFISVMHSPLSSFCFNYTEKRRKKVPLKLQKVAKLGDKGFRYDKVSRRRVLCFEIRFYPVGSVQ